ncbi:hypothetical protein GCM10027416_17560 [Okibacterium endophyticum]
MAMAASSALAGVLTSNPAPVSITLRVTARDARPTRELKAGESVPGASDERVRRKVMGIVSSFHMESGRTARFAAMQAQQTARTESSASVGPVGNRHAG